MFEDFLCQFRELSCNCEKNTKLVQDFTFYFSSYFSILML